MEDAAFPDAIEAFGKASRMLGGNTLLKAALGFAYAAAGKTKDALKVLDELTSLSKEKFVPSYYMAAAYSRLGENDLAIGELKQAYENRENWLAYLRIDPACHELRSMPEFAALLEKIGLG